MWEKAIIGAAITMACSLTAWSGVCAQTHAFDACSVLTREEIKTLTGNDPGQLEPGANSNSDQVTTCYWQRTSPKGSVSLWSKISPNEPKGLALKQLLDRGKKARAVSGLGDDAVFMENPSGTPGATLFVRVGHWRVVIYREAATPLATSESVLPTLTALAKAAIPKLRKAG